MEHNFVMTNADNATKLEDWQMPVQCAKCKDIIWSKTSGEFTSCKCGAISVDQTEYYARYIGNRADFVALTKGDNAS